MALRFRIANIFCFILSVALAFLQKWKLNEFCWIVWISGLIFSCLCVASGFLHFFLDYKNQKAKILEFLPFLAALKQSFVFVFLALLVFISSFAAFFIYTYLFSFYGIFLSVFARMEPLNYFGENGFINSNFWSPVKHLLLKYWQIILITSISNFFMIFKTEPFNKIFAPFKSKEILRIHFMTILLPFLSLLFFAIFKERFELPVIIVLITLFYLTNINLKKTNCYDN